MSGILPDPSTPFGARVARRLRDEPVIWLTTVDVRGTPQPNPVWFLWDGARFLIYTQPDTRRLAHIRNNPRVALNFNSDGQGDDVIVFAGEARLSPDEPPIDQLSAYVEKYRAAIAGMQETPQNLARQYSVALRITPDRVRGF